MDLLKFAGQFDFVDCLVVQFANLPAWLKEWRCDVAQTREFYQLLAKILQLKKKTSLFVEYQSKYLETFNTEAPEVLKAIKAEVITLISTVISDPGIFEVGLLLQLAAVRQFKVFMQTPDILAIFNH